MIDGGVISGYLALAVTRGVDRLMTSKIDKSLAALANRIRDELGPNPFHELRSDPGDRHARSRIARAVEHLARQDRWFADDVARLAGRCDREGGRPLLRQNCACATRTRTTTAC
jgi:hypothetical protein